MEACSHVQEAERASCETRDIEPLKIHPSGLLLLARPHLLMAPQPSEWRHKLRTSKHELAEDISD